MSESSYNATLLRRFEITPELLVILVAVDGGFAEFKPGQYTTLGLLGSARRLAGLSPDREVLDPEKLIKRAYSIGSSPSEKSLLEFYVAVVPDGALSARLAALQVGDRLFVGTKITGTFTLDSVPATADLVLIATGTGLAPYLSMLRLPATWSDGRKITIVHGVRYQRDLAYREELEALSSAGNPLTYIPVVSREAAWKGYAGRVTGLIPGVIQLNPAKDHVYLCGNPAMIDEMEKMLVGMGYIEHTKRTPGSLHLERYW